MNNWSEVLLKDICDITRGASPRPIHDFMTEDLDGIPWVKIRDATASNTRFIENTKGFIKKEGKNKSVSVLFSEWFLLFYIKYLNIKIQLVIV